MVEQRDIPDLGTRFIRFANGVKLTVKPTNFRADEVLVSVAVAGGRLALPKDRVSAVWGASTLISGGLADIDQNDIRRLLATKIYGAGFQMSDESFGLSGRTRPEDVVIQMAWDVLRRLKHLHRRVGRFLDISISCVNPPGHLCAILRLGADNHVVGLHTLTTPSTQAGCRER